MQNTQKTTQRMPGRSAEVVGSELGNVKNTPPAKPGSTPPPAPVPKPVIKLDAEVPLPRP
jgi:hypothetical protein